MKKLHGVIAATPTPLKPDMSIDIERLIGHCRWLLGDGGCDGINLLGTTGEATSFSVEQRIAAMRAVAASGLPLQRMMVGTGASALADAVALTSAARELGFNGALLLPPFYYKGIDAESLADYVGEVIGRAGQSGAEALSLPHPAEYRRAVPGRGDRTAARALSRHDRRPQGFLRRHRVLARARRAVPRLRRVPELGRQPDRVEELGLRRLHFGDHQHHRAAVAASPGPIPRARRAATRRQRRWPSAPCSAAFR